MILSSAGTVAGTERATVARSCLPMFKAGSVPEPKDAKVYQLHEKKLTTLMLNGISIRMDGTNVPHQRFDWSASFVPRKQPRQSDGVGQSHTQRRAPHRRFPVESSVTPTPAAEPHRKLVLAVTPPARPFRQPNRDTINLNDPSAL